MFCYFGYIIPFNIKLVNMSILHILMFIILLQLFYFFYIISFNIELVNMSVFLIHEVCHSSVIILLILICY
jgi:hypothetical protein